DYLQTVRLGRLPWHFASRLASHQCPTGAFPSEGLAGSGAGRVTRIVHAGVPMTAQGVASWASSVRPQRDARKSLARHSPGVGYSIRGASLGPAIPSVRSAAETYETVGGSRVRVGSNCCIRSRAYYPALYGSAIH